MLALHLLGIFLVFNAAEGATTTSSAPLSCTTQHGKKAKNLHCGDYGSVRHPVVLTTLTLPALNDCRDACEFKRPKCHTLAYTASTGQCILYKFALGHMGFKRSSTSGTQVFNIHCFHCRKPVYSTIYTTQGTVAATSTISTASGKHPGLVQVSYPTPVACDNGGLQYAVQSNPYPRGLAQDDPSYTAFSAQAFQTATPILTGNTNYVDIPYVGPGESGYIYGHSRDSLEYTAVNHQGYLFAPATGNYIFNYTLSDDVGLLWTGKTAYSGYTIDKASLYQLYNGSQSQDLQPSKALTVHLKQYDYLPIRILWANAGYAARFFLQITGPKHIGFINYGSQLNSPFLAQFSCDGSSGPAFPNFGSQT